MEGGRPSPNPRSQPKTYSGPKKAAFWRGCRRWHQPVGVTKNRVEYILRGQMLWNPGLPRTMQTSKRLCYVYSYDHDDIVCFWSHSLSSSKTQELLVAPQHPQEQGQSAQVLGMGCPACWEGDKSPVPFPACRSISSLRTQVSLQGRARRSVVWLPTAWKKVTASQNEPGFPFSLVASPFFCVCYVEKFSVLIDTIIISSFKDACVELKW